MINYSKFEFNKAKGQLLMKNCDSIAERVNTFILRTYTVAASYLRQLLKINISHVSKICVLHNKVKLQVNITC